MVGIVANILHEKTRLLTHFLFDDERGLSDELACRIGGADELRDHSAEAPAVMQFPRPGKLHIRLRTTPGNIGRAGRQSHADDGGEVNFAGDRTDLPFDGWRYVGKSRGCRTA